MTKFKYNVVKTKELYLKMIINLSNYNDMIDKVLATVKTSKNVWMDPASDAFYKIVLNDENKIKDIRESLSSYLGCVSYFCSALEKIFTSRGVNEKDLLIDYDSTYINSCINNLNNINDYIQDSIDELEGINYPSNFEYYYEFNSLKRSIKVSKKISSDLYDDLSNIKKEIEDLVLGTSEKVQDIDLILSDNKIIKLDD